jgi:hypothetical protein
MFLFSYTVYYPPPPHAHSFVLGPAVINTLSKHTYSFGARHALRSKVRTLRRARARAPLCATLFRSKFRTLRRARAPRAARSVFPAHLLEIAAWARA